MKLSMLDDFICASTGHATNCHKQIVLISRVSEFQGTMLREIWKCPCCKAELSFYSQDLVTSEKLPNEHPTVDISQT
jgi:hypothetical protein